MAVVGVMMGMMAMGMTADSVVSAANEFTADQYSEKNLGSGTTVSGAIEQSALELEFTGQQNGVDITFNAALVEHPCPDPSGKFDVEITIDVKTHKGDVGSNATIEMRIDGQVDDDAHLAGADVTTNTQWADFASGRGQFLDFTSGSSGDARTLAINRTGGQGTPDFTRLAVTFSTMFEVMMKDKALTAAEHAWTSGRCVQLNVTPSAGPEGLDPSAVVSVLAEPRSKVDGKPAGGNVTATLAAGGQSVEPERSPVPADANVTYTAPDEEDQSATVSFEARSKRGVGKTQVIFKTGAAAAYQVVGGLQAWQVNQLVCDITKPFTLEAPGVGIADYSGGLSGTTSITGIFDSVYSGNYNIVLSDGLGSPGTMTNTTSGTTLGNAGSGVESYVLTPAEPCT